jgi:hypothetical protein
MWGQGLPNGEKFRDRVTGWLQGQFGAARQVIQFPTRSHSGAQITVDAREGDTVPNLHGEIPSGHPSISKQVDLTISDLNQRGIDPGAVDLVLLDGGINDVGALEILKFNHSTETIQRFTNAAMDKMANLLPTVMRSFPCAGVVVTGYFPIVSSASALPELAALFGAFGGELGGPVGAVGGSAVAAAAKPQMVALSRAFANTARKRLTEMIAQLNSSADSARIVLAWPNFESANAYGAPKTFLWKVTDFVGPELDGAAGRHPQPPTTPNGVAWNRARACAVANRASPKCLDASMGHPNQAGALAYANAIIDHLQNTFRVRLNLPPPLQAYVCPTVDGKRCAPLGVVQIGEKIPPLKALVWVKSNGQPVAGANVQACNCPGYDYRLNDQAWKNTVWVKFGGGGYMGVTDVLGVVEVTYQLASSEFSSRPSLNRKSSELFGWGIGINKVGYSGTTAALPTPETQKKLWGH